MLDRQRVGQLLTQLDWSTGLDREQLYRQLLSRNIALSNEFLSAIQPIDVYYTPEELIGSVPDVVWTIHAERERRAVGHLQPHTAAAQAQASRTRSE